LGSALEAYWLQWTFTGMSYIQNQIQIKNLVMIVKFVFLSDVLIRRKLCFKLHKHVRRRNLRLEWRVPSPFLTICNFKPKLR